MLIFIGCLFGSAILVIALSKTRVDIIRKDKKIIKENYKDILNW